jgi:hypothetical protein
MRARLIIDCEATVNPDYHPPLPIDFKSEEAYHDALHIYNLDHSKEGGIIPAGTEVAHINAWVLCWPPSEFEFEVDTDTGRRTPIRLGNGLIGSGAVKAEPIDDGCRAALTHHIRHVAAMLKVEPQQIADELAQRVAQSKARQANAEAARAALAKLVPSLPIPDPSLPTL